jgi:geranylgeranyl pyrophosphate synthase
VSEPATALVAWLDRTRPLVDAELARRLSSPAGHGADARLGEAMRYAALGAGKRLRPAMAIAACEAVGGHADHALPAAAAVELLHAYTLVHDDLPALDDDDERRGRPTVHRAFDEATAILAGDALLTAAFGCLADLGARACAAVEVLAARAGATELIGGQAIDLALTTGAAPDFELVEDLHAKKTGALFAAAAELGAIAGGGDVRARRALARYGMCVGIAFQFADDRDDADFAEHAQRARTRAAELIREGLDRLEGFHPVKPLVALAEWIGSRV